MTSREMNKYLSYSHSLVYIILYWFLAPQVDGRVWSHEDREAIHQEMEDVQYTSSF